MGYSQRVKVRKITVYLMLAYNDKSVAVSNVYIRRSKGSKYNLTSHLFSQITFFFYWGGKKRSGYVRLLVNVKSKGDFFYP